MSIINLPTTLRIGAGGGMGQARFDLLTQSDSTGAQQARLLAPPRWTLRLVQPDHLTQATASAWQALAVQLRGRVNVLAAWNPAQPAPLGTARGVLTTAGTTAAGAVSVGLSGALASPNLLLDAGFETDSNSDGVANGWAVYLSGTTGATSASLSVGPLIFGSSGVRYQEVSAATLNGRIGVLRTIAVQAGASYSLSADVSASLGATVSVSINWLDAGLAYLSEVVTSGGPFIERRTVSGQAPVGAAYAQLYLYAASTAASAAIVNIDNVQFEAAAAATSYAGGASLLAGDWLQIGSGLGMSHLCMVTADATANDAGAITVAIEPPTRQAFSAGTAVTWDKPVGYYRQQTDSTTWTFANGGRSGVLVTGLSFDLMETWA